MSNITMIWNNFSFEMKWDDLWITLRLNCTTITHSFPLPGDIFPLEELFPCSHPFVASLRHSHLFQIRILGVLKIVHIIRPQLWQNCSINTINAHPKLYENCIERRLHTRNFKGSLIYITQKSCDNSSQSINFNQSRYHQQYLDR